MIPLVWDFGQLDTETEEAYARQIALRYVKINNLISKFSLIFITCNFVLKSFNGISN